MKLTDEILLNVVRKDKVYKIYDGEGLFIEIPAHGNLRWRFKYMWEGKENRISLGVYPDVPIQEARERRENCLHMLKNGTNPSHARKQDKNEENINEVAEKLVKNALALRAMEDYSIKLKKILLLAREELRLIMSS